MVALEEIMSITPRLKAGGILAERKMIRITWKDDKVGDYKYTTGEVYLTYGAMAEKRIGSIDTFSRADWLEFRPTKENFCMTEDDLIDLGMQMKKKSEQPL